jgi:hypothetical protein
MIAPLYNNALDGDVQMRQQWLAITNRYALYLHHCITRTVHSCVHMCMYLCTCLYTHLVFDDTSFFQSFLTCLMLLIHCHDLSPLFLLSLFMSCFLFLSFSFSLPHPPLLILVALNSFSSLLFSTQSY